MQKHNRRFSATLIEKLMLHEKENGILSTFCRVKHLEFSLKRVSILHLAFKQSNCNTMTLNNNVHSSAFEREWHEPLQCFSSSKGYGITWYDLGYRIRPSSAVRDGFGLSSGARRLNLLMMLVNTMNKIWSAMFLYPQVRWPEKKFQSLLLYLLHVYIGN